jgi:putative FmdB family regulatory protein
MPNYDYECENCSFKFRISHSITIKMTDCDECSTQNSLRRFTHYQNKINFVDKTENQQVGSVVKQSIEEFKEELELQRSDLKSREHNG